MHPIIKQITTQGLLPLYFHSDRQTCVNILHALYNAGVRVVEFTNRGAEALENFRHMKDVAARELNGMLLGAGTIKTEKHANDFLEAGADFLISPGWNKKVLKAATKNNK